MGYHPETMVFSFPPYPKGGMSLVNHPQPWSFGRWLYGLSPWIGFDVWHIDPEKPVPGRRRDDSCGWFPRDLTPPIQKAVDELLGGGWSGERLMLENALVRAAPYDVRYPSLKRMQPGDGYSLALMFLTLIDRLSLHNRRSRWRRGREWPAQLRVLRLAQQLTLNDADNLLSCETPEQFIKLLAAAYRRDIRLWWQHPRWHIHHWRVNVHFTRNLRRTFQRCPACQKRLGFACVPHSVGDGRLYHGSCSPSVPTAVAAGAAQ